MRLSAQVVRITPEALDTFRAENIKIPTGTGTCYVQRGADPQVQAGPTGAAPGIATTPRTRPERPERPRR